MGLMNRCLVLMAVAAFCMPHAYADAESSLRKQVEVLTERVNQLEQRLNTLESPELKQMVEQVTAPVNPGHSDDQSNWNRLKVGYNYNEVSELLGEPVRIKKGGMEFWFYSDQGLDGPFVKFLFKKVNDWKAPQE